jgi:hypothetical protein
MTNEHGGLDESLPVEDEPGPGLREEHLIRCVYCHGAFDLFAARWCAHDGGPHPSKICLACERCLCLHPSYKDDFFWKDAPPAFRRNGFRKLFLIYI